jgi:hypothetical protein
MLTSGKTAIEGLWVGGLGRVSSRLFSTNYKCPYRATYVLERVSTRIFEL